MFGRHLGTALTFVLREGINFHDRTAFNAETVKAVCEFGKGNDNFSAIKAVANLDYVEVIDEYKVTFHYPGTTQTVLKHVSFVVPLPDAPINAKPIPMKGSKGLWNCEEDQV